MFSNFNRAPWIPVLSAAVRSYRYCVIWRCSASLSTKQPSFHTQTKAKTQQPLLLNRTTRNLNEDKVGGCSTWRGIDFFWSKWKKKKFKYVVGSTGMLFFLSFKYKTEKMFYGLYSTCKGYRSLLCELTRIAFFWRNIVNSGFFFD